MQATALADTIRLDSVDEILGDRATRFFGEGFKRVTHTLTDLSIRPADGATPGRIDATAGIDIPGTWSRKGSSDQRPHLSTIDVMLFGAQLVGLYAAHTHALDPSGPFQVRSLAIKAGSDPDEDDLDAFPVSALLHSTTELPGSGNTLTTMDCRIGSLTVRVAAEHAAPARNVPSPGAYTRAEELPGPWNTAPYGASHRDRRQLLTDVEADPAGHTASAALAVTGTPAGTSLPPTMIDLFTSALQLGQVLLYELDGLDRASSNTLWMRSTTIAPATAPDPDNGDDRFRTRLSKPVKLPTAAGTWRVADIASTHAGLHLNCKVAHLLP